jgi:hypothetical protein
MASAAGPLLEEVKRRFYPFVEARGFARVKTRSPQCALFRRKSATRCDSFEIQWDKYWRPYFVLNFGPGSGDIGPSSSERSGRLQRRRGGDLCCWFSLRRPWRNRLRTWKWNYTPAEVVEELISAFDELETWWSRGEAGPHIYVYSLHS